MFGRCLFMSLVVAISSPETVGAASRLSVVSRGLNWLTAQQANDGAWRFPANTKDAADATANHATGLVLLAYLGVGQKHKDGNYQKQVDAGLKFLLANMQVENGRGDLRGGGDMTSHGLAALAICEAYGMTYDKKLKEAATMALYFTEETQSETGGWPPQPGKPDDMHVFAWQILVLRSAYAAHLEVDPKVIERAAAYLDRQQTEGGRYFGRHMPGQERQATAIGMHSRHWMAPLDHQTLTDSVNWLVRNQPPNANNIEQVFFVSLCCRECSPTAWNRWWRPMRVYLQESAEEDGPERSSWLNYKDPATRRYGRLGQTAMSVLAFEVYYRHLPVFQKDTVLNYVERKEAEREPSVDDLFGAVEQIRR